MKFNCFIGSLAHQRIENGNQQEADVCDTCDDDSWISKTQNQRLQKM